MTRTARTAYMAKRTPTKTPEYLERWSKESSTSEKRRERQERRAAAGVHLFHSLSTYVCGCAYRVFFCH
jgi:hypothetical protein